MKLHFSFFIWVALIVRSTVMASDKIDEAIDLKQQSFVPVFIRMSDQVIGRAGEYEKLCREHSGNPRAQNRKDVIAQLRGKADEAWQKIEKTANALVQNGGIRSIRQFWIVNGFSCLAKPTAIRKFAKRADISFIYFDRFASPSKKPLPMSGNAMTAMKKVLATWTKKAPVFPEV